jgi:hypothetical protein
MTLQVHCSSSHARYTCVVRHTLTRVLTHALHERHTSPSSVRHLLKQADPVSTQLLSGLSASSNRLPIPQVFSHEARARNLARLLPARRPARTAAITIVETQKWARCCATHLRQQLRSARWLQRTKHTPAAFITRLWGDHRELARLYRAIQAPLSI